jgi:hypothetical protein
MSFQISAIFSNASSTPQFSCDRSFTFGNLDARGDAPLAGDARAEELPAAERGFLERRLSRRLSELRSYLAMDLPRASARDPDQ